MKKRILYVLQGIGMGGVSSVILNYYRMLKDDIEADFVVIVPFQHIPDEIRNELAQNGCRIFHVTPFVKNMFKYQSEVAEIIKEGKYDIVHDNNKYFAFLSLRSAKKIGIPIRICHVHNTVVAKEKGFLHEIFIKLTSALSIRYSTELLACSDEAGKSMFGKNSFRVLNNAIEVKQFRFSDEKRKKWREELHIEKAFAIIMVARKEVLKRYDFAFRVFHEINQKRSDSVFLVVGMDEKECTGRDREAYDKLSSEEKDRVKLMGRRLDANELLSAADAFILTSEHEGFGISIVEAQASGLPCFVSESIPHSTDCTGLVKYMPTVKEAGLWADEICKADVQNRDLYAEIVDNGSYSIKHNLSELKRVYGE